MSHSIILSNELNKIVHFLIHAPDSLCEKVHDLLNPETPTNSITVSPEEAAAIKQSPEVDPDHLSIILPVGDYEEVTAEDVSGDDLPTGDSKEYSDGTSATTSGPEALPDLSPAQQQLQDSVSGSVTQ
jgi:hypothetical protein